MSHRILIVEDEAPMRKILADILAKAGKDGEYAVDTAADGVEGLQKLEGANFDFDLVLTDIMMPRMSGTELLMKIKEKAPQLPVVVLTAYPKDENVLWCLKNGASDFLAKPVSVPSLVNCIRRVFERQRHFQEDGGIEVTSGVKGWVELTAPSKFEYVERFQRFTAQLYDTELSDREREDIRVAIGELGQNAIEWGNREDAAKKIHLSYCLFNDRIVFKIEDEGVGFDATKLADPSKNPLEHIMERMQSGKRLGGYGIFITKSLMDDIVYNDKGNVVLITKYLRRGEKKEK